MARIREKSNTIDYSRDTPILIAQEPEDQQRREYTALRDIIQKRLKRIDASAQAGKYDDDSVDPRNFPFYRYWDQHYDGKVPEMKDLHSDRDLHHVLSIMKKQIGSDNTYLDTKTGELKTYKGWMTATQPGINKFVKNVLKGLHREGYTDINRDNLKDFGHFMERYRDDNLEKVYGSAQVVEMWVSTQNKGITQNTIMDNFKYFMDHADDLDKMTPEEIKEDLQSMKVNRGKGKTWQ